MGVFTDVCVLSHQKDCLGVSEGSKEGRVICTYASSVEVYNVSWGGREGGMELLIVTRDTHLHPGY